MGRANKYGLVTTAFSETSKSNCEMNSSLLGTFIIQILSFSISTLAYSIFVLIFLPVFLFLIEDKLGLIFLT